MSKEARLGLFALLVLAAAIWGYKYLKGQNLLSKSYTFKSVYDDVNQLTVSSPVLFNGLTVGAVTNIEVNPLDLSQMIVTYGIEKDFKIPKDAIAYQVSNGVINGKAVSIKYKKVCEGDNCAESGDFLEGRVLGFIGSMIGQEEVKEYLGSVTSELSGVVEGMGSEDSKGAVNEAIRELNKTMKNLESLTRTSDALMKNSYKGLTKTIDNMSVITGNLAASNAQISGMLTNLNAITEDIKKANVGNTIASTNKTLEETQLAIKKLQGTLDSTDDMVAGITGVVAKVNDGNGSLGKLINDQELYTNLEETSKNLSLLLQDLRLNPKRYVNVSIFGKKNKNEYTVPEDDPAFQED